MSTTSSSSSSLTLPSLFHRTLHSLLPIFSDTISLSSPSAQNTLTSSLADLQLILRMISTLGVFSENEELEDVGDGEMIYMCVEWVRGEVEGRVNGEGGMSGRLRTLEASKSSLESFLFLLETYSFPLPPSFSFPSTLPSHSDSDSHSYGNGSGNGQASTSRAAGQGGGFGAVPRDQAGRREMKIRQYRMEKEWREKVTAALPGVSITSSPLPAIIAILEASQSSSSSSNDQSPTSSTSNKLKISSSNPTNPLSSSTDHLRETTISLLTLLLIQSVQSLSSIEQELDLLRSAASSARIIDEDNERREAERAVAQRRQEGSSSSSALRPGEHWRLDLPLNSLSRNGHGLSTPSNLTDNRGKPTQPFTILPSAGLQSLSDRARLGAEVWRSGHRLPTMTIEEYLEEERRRGNIITGGGAQSAEQPTTNELLQLAEEQDGTRESEVKGEEKRLKDENWARFTEENRKGAGNTMNRG